MALTPELIRAGFTKEPDIIHRFDCPSPRLTCCPCGKNVQCKTCGYGYGQTPCDCDREDP